MDVPRTEAKESFCERTVFRRNKKKRTFLPFVNREAVRRPFRRITMNWLNF